MGLSSRTIEMNTNSIIKEITPQTIANEIRMNRAVLEGAFLLVEGQTDFRIFERFVNPEKCTIIDCRGNENLFGTITILEDDHFAGVIAIADKDYFDIIGYPYYRGSVVFTDENDLEMMILSSSALQHTIQEFGSENKIDAQPDEVHVQIAEWASIVGALRLASISKSWALDFDGMTYKFVDSQSPQLCAKKTPEHIVGRTKTQTKPSVDDAIECSNGLIKIHTAQALSNGHDCVAVLAKALKRKYGSTNAFNSDAGRINLEKTLRLAYDFDMFRGTQVFDKICKWETKTGYNLF